MAVPNGTTCREARKVDMRGSGVEGGIVRSEKSTIVSARLI